MKHVLLVGGTGGIGRELAREFLARGWRVGIVARDARKTSRLTDDLRAGHAEGYVSATLCDVTDVERIEPVFEKALSRLGQLDLLVYCAGVMPPEAGGATARVTAARENFSVNVLGAIAFLELAADYLEQVGRGRLAAIGSVAGERGRRGRPAYGASKAALHSYLEGLRHRMHGSGVGVSTVKPGWVDTPMLEGAPRAAIDAGSAARRIVDGLVEGREVFFVPRWWRFVAVALRATPRFLFKRFGPE